MITVPLVADNGLLPTTVCGLMPAYEIIRRTYEASSGKSS